MTALDWATQRVVRVPGFADAKRVLEIGAGDLSRGRSLAETYPHLEVHSTDYVLDAKSRQSFLDAVDLPNLHCSRVDVRDTLFKDNSFDFIFSVALMEHVAEIEDCLREIHRILRPGGVYYFIQAPFWSCAQGHHFYHWDDRIYEAIPKYGHLTMTRQQMREHLESQDDLFFEIDHCLDRVFDRPDLSRQSRNQSFARISDGPLALEAWDDYDDRKFDSALAKAAASNLLYPIEPGELKTAGAYVTLRKATATATNAPPGERLEEPTLQSSPPSTIERLRKVALDRLPDSAVERLREQQARFGLGRKS